MAAEVIARFVGGSHEWPNPELTSEKMGTLSGTSTVSAPGGDTAMEYARNLVDAMT
jgi:hypothetical protein